MQYDVQFSVFFESLLFIKRRFIRDVTKSFPICSTQELWIHVHLLSLSTQGYLYIIFNHNNQNFNFYKLFFLWLHLRNFSSSVLLPVFHHHFNIIPLSPVFLQIFSYLYLFIPVFTFLGVNFYSVIDPIVHSLKSCFVQLYLQTFFTEFFSLRIIRPTLFISVSLHLASISFALSFTIRQSIFLPLSYYCFDRFWNVVAELSNQIRVLNSYLGLTFYGHWNRIWIIKHTGALKRIRVFGSTLIA